MKNRTWIISLFGVVLFSSTAFAEEKSATRIKFNELIDDNNLKRAELSKRVEAQKTRDESKEKSDVIDFINLEVGIGEAPALVDRRYNNVGAIKVVRIADPTK